MPLSLGTIITIVIGVTGAIVGPLYILVLRGYGDSEVANEERGNLEDEQEEIRETLKSIEESLEVVETEVRLNAERSERNQNHIHQLLLGKMKDDDTDIGNPHYQAEYCPLPGECPWHGHSDE